MAAAGKTPAALLNRPQLDHWEQAYWDAYVAVQGSRQYTFSGPAEIPYPCKIQWLDENNITDPETREDYLDCITAIDRAYIDHCNKKDG